MTTGSRVIVAGSLAALAVAAACQRPSGRSSPAESEASAPSASAPASATPPLPAASSAASRPDAAAETPGTQGGCPDGMLLVEGELCPAAVQLCKKHHKEYEENKESATVSERCLEYQDPSRCLSKQRKQMRFCIDRYEWPSKQGELPLVLVQWTEAKQHCESVGKRLCDEEEWLFACEGEQMLPYVYGFVRDATKCSIDRPYVKRETGLKRYEPCQADPECKATFAKLDQRKPAGSFPGCVSPFGVFDMNGNANEWVNLPGKAYPDRSGLKGGWWGPVRSRCRPTVTFHKEEDWGYEAGFRCCKNAP